MTGGSGPAARRERLAVWAIAALALAVRAAGIGWGLPDETRRWSFHPDEGYVAAQAWLMAERGSLAPSSFHYGTLTTYLTLALALPGRLLGLYGTRPDFYVVGRLVTLAFGVGSVVLAGALGRRLYGPSAGLAAAALLAAAPGHALHSAFGTVDVPTGFFVLLALLAAARRLEDDRPRSSALGGAAAGLAAAAKYNGGLVLLPVLLSVLLAPTARRPRAREAVAACAAAGAAFLAACPYAVLDAPFFVATVRFKAAQSAVETVGPIFRGTGNGWWWHLSVNGPYLLGPPLLLLALGGLALVAIRRRPADLLLLSFAVPYFALVGAAAIRFMRYLLPLAPVAAVAAGALLGRIERPAVRRTLLACAVGYAALLSAWQAAAMRAVDPRERAAAFLDERAGPGEAIGLATPAYFHSPPFRRPHVFSHYDLWDAERFRVERPPWFVASEFEWREHRRLDDPAERDFFAALEGGYHLAARFESIPADRRLLFGGRFAPHDWLYPFAEVRVYRRRDA